MKSLFYKNIMMVLLPFPDMGALDRGFVQVISPDGRLMGNVVFLTGIDRRDDLGIPNRFDIYLREDEPGSHNGIASDNKAQP